jgi:hypothetical protein
MSDDNRGWKIAVFALLGAIALGGICICGGTLWFVAQVPEMDESLEQMQRDGERVGANGTTDDCMRRGYEEAHRCGLSVGCSPDDFIRACLRAVPEPDPTLCVGAPSEPGVLTDEAFADGLCARYGWDAELDDDCHTVVSAVEVYCQGNAR